MKLRHLFLQCGIEPTVVYTESDQLHVLSLHRASGNGCILLLKVVGEFRAIMSAVGFGEDTKVSVLILWELRIEGLDQLPDVGSGSYSAVDGVGTI